MGMNAKTLFICFMLGASLFVSGCGRKSQLETPTGPSADAATQKDVRGSTARNESESADELDLAGTRGPKRPFVLDPLL